MPAQSKLSFHSAPAASSSGKRKAHPDVTDLTDIPAQNGNHLFSDVHILTLTSQQLKDMGVRVSDDGEWIGVIDAIAAVTKKDTHTSEVWWGRFKAVDCLILTKCENKKLKKAGGARKVKTDCLRLGDLIELLQQVPGAGGDAIRRQTAQISVAARINDPTLRKAMEAAESTLDDDTRKLFAAGMDHLEQCRIKQIAEKDNLIQKKDNVIKKKKVVIKNKNKVIKKHENATKEKDQAIVVLNEDRKRKQSVMEEQHTTMVRQFKEKTEMESALNMLGGTSTLVGALAASYVTSPQTRTALDEIMSPFKKHKITPAMVYGSQPGVLVNVVTTQRIKDLTNQEVTYLRVITLSLYHTMAYSLTEVPQRSTGYRMSKREIKESVERIMRVINLPDPPTKAFCSNAITLSTALARIAKQRCGQDYCTRMPLIQAYWYARYLNEFVSQKFRIDLPVTNLPAEVERIFGPDGIGSEMQVVDMSDFVWKKQSAQE